MKHTIPDIPGDLADEYSVYAYWRDISGVFHSSLNRGLAARISYPNIL